MTTTTTGVLPATGLWNIDSRHSTMRFRVRHHAVASFGAAFYPITGAFDAAARRLHGEVRVEDLVVPIEMLANHLRSDAFFDGANHPTISFESTSIEEDGPSLAVAGNLTMRGVTRPVAATGTAVAPVAVRHQNDVELMHFGIDLAATIDRREWGVDFNNQLPSGVFNLGWDVSVEIALELIRAEDG